MQAASALAQQRTVRSLQRGPDLYLVLEDLAGYYGMRLRLGEKDIFLSSRLADLRFTAERREALINGIKVNLCLAPVLAEGYGPALSELDFRVVMDPLLRRNAVPPRRIDRIMVDPGHGGKDPGARSSALLEKNFNLSVARILAHNLRVYGYTVALTRERDVFVSLEERADSANRWGADLFISIHANAAGNQGVHGIETFFLTPAGAASAHGGKRQTESAAGNRFDPENVRFSYAVQRNLLVSTNAADRGIKQARFSVLQNAACPAILVECGFLSNAAESRRLASLEYQQRLVRGILGGLREFHAGVRER